jgi:hypothetical protein
MTMEYRCPEGHTAEVFFRSISAAAAVPSIPCPECGMQATKIISAPLGFHLYGDPAGYYKPSPTKRLNTKLAHSAGNDKSAG